MTTSSNPDPGYKLTVSREFAAPRELVWQAWTQPAHVKNWLGLGEGPAVESVRIDLRVGGKFRIQTKKDGEFYTAAGTYLEVAPLERLIYTWDWEKDGAGNEFGELEGRETQVTVEFRAAGPRTMLTLTHEKFVTPETRDRHQYGWQMWLEKLAHFTAETKS